MGLLKDLANAPARALQALLSDKKDETRISARKAKRSFSLSENTKTRLRCPRMSVLPASIPIARFT